MKLRPHVRWLFSLVTAFCVTVPATKATAPAHVAAAQILYVTVACDDLAAFAQHRYALTTGCELFLATLKDKAAEEARAVNFHGIVVVLDEGVIPPAGARALCLTWSISGVVADYLDGTGAAPRNLGLVSATPLDVHPNYHAMERELVLGSSDRRSDAAVRAQAQLNLYLALQRVAPEFGHRA